MSLVQIEEMNVAESVTSHIDANGKACANIFFTSTLNFVFLIATNGYALSDAHPTMFLLTKSGLLFMWPQKIMYSLGMSRHVRS